MLLVRAKFFRTLLVLLLLIKYNLLVNNQLATRLEKEAFSYT